MWLSTLLLCHNFDSPVGDVAATSPDRRVVRYEQSSGY